MRRLLAWGRQDPQCPAEAASPPPLSAFHSPCSVFPPPSKLFTDIERQLSARVAAEPLPLRSAQSQPSPPTEAANERTSPPEPMHVHSAVTKTTAFQNTTTATADQQQQQRQQHSVTNFEMEQPNSRRDSFAQQSPNVGRLSSSDLCAQQQQHIAQQQFSAQPLAQKVQQVTNTELAANFLANAFAAQQSPSMELLANLKASNQSQLQPIPPLNSPLVDSSQSSSIGGSAALNAFHLVQQTAQFNQQKIVAEQQQRQLISAAATMAMKSSLSPQSSVFGGSEVGGIPALLSRLSSVPEIFRTVGSGPNHSKPIPLLEERVDLLQFKRKEPREWSSDDVVAWILDVARRHQIPCENLNLAKFANCTGPLLMLMNEQSFNEHDPNYGSLLFSEFCKLVTDENFIDEWMKVNGNVIAGPSSASNQSLLAQFGLKKPTAVSPSVPTTFLQHTALLGQLALQQEKRQQQQLLLAESVTGTEQQPMDATVSVAAGTSTSLLLNAVVAVTNSQQQRQEKPQLSPVVPLQPSPMVGQSAIVSLSRMIQPIQQQQQQQNHQTLATNGPGAPMFGQQNHLSSGISHLVTAHQQRLQHHHILKSNACEGAKRGVGRPTGSKNKAEKQIKRNKDGRPRKRSQHTKGNKLWEFIRDALKDPRTCPSVVRWENPAEGVFRIVESERLAFLWGQKKNNQKMTYEKLSRAMRTYYEKEILVPVPKSGLYPKKLVYKFGPTAHGWRASASLAVQANLALISGPSMSM